MENPLEIDLKNTAQMQNTIDVLNNMIQELNCNLDSTLERNKDVIEVLEDQIKSLNTTTSELLKATQVQDEKIKQYETNLNQLRSQFEQDLLSYQSKSEQELLQMRFKVEQANEALQIKLEHEQMVEALKQQLIDAHKRHKYETSLLEKSHLLEKRTLNEEMTSKLQIAVDSVRLNYKSKLTNSLSATLDENKKLESYTNELVQLTRVLTEQNHKLMKEIEAIKVKNQ